MESNFLMNLLKKQLFIFRCFWQVENGSFQGLLKSFLSGSLVGV